MEDVGAINTLSLSPDGSQCVTGAVNHQSMGRNALIWDVRSLSVVGELKGHCDGVYSSAWSPAGGIVATGGGGTDHLVRLWDVKSLRQIGELGRDLFFVHALAFSPDGHFLLTGSANNAPAAPVHDGSCFRLWDVQRCKEVARLGVHASSVQSVVFSSDGRTAACGNSGQLMLGGKAGERAFCPQTIRFWDIKPRLWNVRATEKFTGVVEHTAWVNSVRFTPDGRNLFTAGRGCFLWELPSCQVLRRFRPDAFDLASCGDVSSDGRYVATGSGGQDDVGAPYRDCAVRLWDVSTEREIARWSHVYPVKTLAFSPAEALVVAGGDHGELRTWRLPASDAPIKTTGVVAGLH
jgi:WD40 repeat protein